MGMMDSFKTKKSLSDLQEQNDQLKLEAENEELNLSIAQRKALQQKLKANGLNQGMFGGLKQSWEWFKHH